VGRDEGPRAACVEGGDVVCGEIIEYLDTGEVLAKGVDDEDIIVREAGTHGRVLGRRGLALGGGSTVVAYPERRA
jgi:hypothetical protein